jgi:hypothetical protein
MTKLITAVLASMAVFMAVGEVYAYINYPWCARTERRGFQCAFKSKAECVADSDRGFGTNCMENPWYNPKLPFVVEQIPGKTPDQSGRKPRRP